MASADIVNLRAEVERLKEQVKERRETATALAGRLEDEKAALARVRVAVDKARRETASDPDNRWCRNATIILNEAQAALEGRG